MLLINHGITLFYANYTQNHAITNKNKNIAQIKKQKEKRTGNKY